MKIVKAFICMVITLAVFILLDTKTGSIPPIGKFLNPFRGFWQNAEAREADNNELKIEGLNGQVEIQFDEHRVPHIFAQNEYDLYFAQGFITAKDRLWQLDFQSRFASGRLSEVVGEKAIELDRYQRRMGMVYGAENMLKELEKHPKIKTMTEAYADGINAYITSLDPEDYPIEFKILDYKPEKWTPLNTGLLLKLMSATLAGGSDEFYMSNVLSKFGPEITNDLFPDYPFKTDPIIPAGTKWDFKPVDIPYFPKDISPIDQLSAIYTRQKVEGIGSNNWAVSGNKTQSGFPLLANDPHLDLTLPAIWYQTQLTGPGINVYGVSIPGAPGIVIGFNQKVAWGVTNVGADVLDWYKIKFRDKTHTAYLHDGHWKAPKQRIEKISIRGKKSISDTVYYTHHGPVVYLSRPDFSKADNVPIGFALRWIAHDPSVDIATFYYLNRAANYTDYRKALSLYTAPAQNFVFASVDNDISITSNGYFPLKWKGHGKFLLNGTLKQNDWQGRIPFQHNPTVKNPKRGFVSSANQNPTDKSYPYFLNWEFGAYERGYRINSELSKMTTISVDSLRKLQNDNYSLTAQNVLPTMLVLIDKNNLTASEHEAYTIVAKWNYRFDADAIAASIFEMWQTDLHGKIWDDEFKDANLPMRLPNRDRTVQLLLNEPDSKWFDNSSTPFKETRKDLVEVSFKASINMLQEKFGLLGNKWNWGNVKASYVPHLAKINGFGSKNLYTGGSKTAVNALGKSNGPSWRMVVALGKENKGYGVFPGGQSGNPGSFYYDDMIDIWSKGELNKLLFLKTKTEKNIRIKYRLLLQK